MPDIIVSDYAHKGGGSYSSDGITYLSPETTVDISDTSTMTNTLVQVINHDGLTQTITDSVSTLSGTTSQCGCCPCKEDSFTIES